MKVTTKKPPAKKVTETEVQDYLLRQLKNSGWLAVRVNSGVQKLTDGNYKKRFFTAYWIANNGETAGMTDVIAFRGDPSSDKNEAILVEVKKDEKQKPSESQIKFSNLAQECGVRTWIVHSKQHVDWLMASLKSEVSA